jgi:hypothetical protein
MGTGRPAVAERWFDTADAVADESETAAAPERTKVNAIALIANFIGGNLSRKRFDPETIPNLARAYIMVVIKSNYFSNLIS